MGEKEISDSVYYGVQTLRALENFKITDIPISIGPRFVQALGYVKKAAALANMDLGVLPDEIARAIIAACDAVIAGELNDQFVVDVIQGGAGASTNMNANEVIANKALEILGHEKGRYEIVHPNNHVNCSQSTNDAYPTAFRLALLLIIPDLMEALQSLSQAFRDKAEEFKDILKMGRTQLQDAVPMSPGQEFGAFATTITDDVERLKVVSSLFHEINLGATAIGTGINAPPGHAPVAVDHLKKLTGLPMQTSVDLIEASWDTGAYAQLSGLLRRIAVKLSKICNDLRLLSSGPRTGLNEINLPKMQPGSSIMPGKVNPVIPEVVNQIAFEVIGMDVTVTLAAEAGQLHINKFALRFIYRSAGSQRFSALAATRPQFLQTNFPLRTYFLYSSKWVFTKPTFAAIHKWASWPGWGLVISRSKGNQSDIVILLFALDIFSNKVNY